MVPIFVHFRTVRDGKATRLFCPVSARIGRGITRLDRIAEPFGYRSAVIPFAAIVLALLVARFGLQAFLMANRGPEENNPAAAAGSGARTQPGAIYHIVFSLVLLCTKLHSQRSEVRRVSAVNIIMVCF